MMKFVGARPYGTGHMDDAQHTTLSRPANVAHPPLMVRITNELESHFDDGNDVFESHY